MNPRQLEFLNDEATSLFSLGSYKISSVFTDRIRLGKNVHQERVRLKERKRVHLKSHLQISHLHEYLKTQTLSQPTLRIY